MKKLLLFILVLISACNHESITDNYQTNIDNNYLDIIDDNFITISEASEVSNQFFKFLLSGTEDTSVYAKRMAVRTNNIVEKETIENIEVIFLNETNIPAMYIINYKEGGFVIISASRSYYPVLAYSDNSYISLENIQKGNIGLFLWCEETKSAIKESQSFIKEDLLKISNIWNSYKKKIIENEITRNYTNDQYMRFYQRMSELYTLCPGYSFGPLSSAQNFLTDSEYYNLTNIANSYGSPLECTIIGYKNKPAIVVGPLIGTNWHQNSSFNNLCPNQYPAGCVAIAMAQIMKFHEIPNNYNWSNMPNNYGTTDTQILIYDIGNAANMNYGPNGSGSTIDNAQNAFANMGYNVLKKDHNYQDVKNELLINKRPVYMKGNKKTLLGITSWEGHAWVCEGAKLTDNSVNYFVEYQLAHDYSSLGGPSINSPIGSNGYSTLYFYLNWGWGDNNGNGWFGFDNVNSPLGSYEYNRKNLFVSPK